MEVPTAKVREYPGMPGRRQVVLSVAADDAGALAVAHALLSPILDVRGIAGPAADVVAALGDRSPLLPAEPAAALVELARADHGPLFLIATGELTDVAAALELDHEALSGRLLLVTADPASYADTSAAEAVLAADIDRWQVPDEVSARFGAYAEVVREKLETYGDLGRLLAPHATRAAMRGVAAVGLVVNPTAALWQRHRGPEDADFRSVVQLDETWLAVDLVAKVAERDRG